MFITNVRNHIIRTFTMIIYAALGKSEAVNVQVKQRVYNLRQSHAPKPCTGGQA